MLDDFVFGTATSAYQIEGAWNEDGKCPSIWDSISHGKTQFRVQDNHTGDIACDHYHRWEQDIKLMKHLGINAYRFSISWSRICTQKCVCSNLKGIKFYQNLVKKLKENNIEPFVTLYHWDLPQWLDDIGGWSNPKSIEYFKCYAETMYNALPDVKYWITFNEPAVFVRNYWGHNNMPKAIKNVLLAHGKAIENIDAKVGISLNLIQVYPATWDNPRDKLAVKNLNKIHNEIWLDPIFKGELPKDINKLYNFQKTKLRFSKDEKQTVSYPIDFLGINYYSTINVKYHKYKPPGYYQGIPGNFARDEMNVEIRPRGIHDICTNLKTNYGNPEMYITENGCAFPDTFVHDKRIHDTKRIAYIREHLKSCDLAIKDGANLRGYFYWSFMDNFEWLFGYNKHFGLIYIFCPTQSRVCKDSYHWYQKIIKDKKFRNKELGETD